MSNRVKYVVISIVACLVFIACGLYVAHFEMRKPTLEVYFFNLNRGHSVFLRTPHGKTILIDGGQSGDVLRELTKVFPFYRRRIDTLIVTSAAPKNVGGLVEVVERFQVGKVIEPNIMGTSTALVALQKIIERKGLRVEKVEKGDEFEIDSIKFRVLFPDPDFKFNKTSLPELILHISYRTSTILLLGDVSKTIQKSVISEVGKVSIVEYAHAAAKSRVSPELLSHIDVDTTVTSKREGTVRFEFR